MSQHFIPIPSLRDAASQDLAARMHALATQMAGTEAIADFGRTGWLPDAFFTLLEALYDSYDAYIHHNIEASALKIQCRAGCARCCRQMVHGTYAFEIIHLYRTLRTRADYGQLHDAFLQRANAFQGFLAEFGAHPANAAATQDDALVHALRRYAAANLWCPLLVDNACSAYAQRPVPCRMYHSLTDPILCVTPIGQTFNLEPPAAVSEVLAGLSDRLAFPYSNFLAQGLVAFAAMRQFRPWAPPANA